MNKSHIVQAWKSGAHRAGMNAQALAALPEHPAGPRLAELDAPELQNVSGAEGEGYFLSITYDCAKAGTLHDDVCFTWKIIRGG